MKKKKELRKEIKKIMKVIKRLRDPIKGCPWDKKQNHMSLIPFAIEEAYEVADAIRYGSNKELKEELGDLLLQVLLHAEIAREKKKFDLTEIIRKLRLKLIRRHPHIFKNNSAQTIEEVEELWNSIKESEKSLKHSSAPISEQLKVKCRSISPLNGSIYISKKAAKAGLEWESLEQVWLKLDEEIDELKSAIAKGYNQNIQEEFGDVVFTLINIARWEKIDPEESIATSNRKFLNRFSFLEQTADKPILEYSRKELQKIWIAAKKHIINEVE